MAPRAYNNETRLQQQAALKARIAEAAAALHATQGALATSYAQIAEAAGVSLPTVYKHYPTLDDLVQACTAHVAAGAPPFPAEAILAAPDLPAAAAALVAALDATHAYYAPWLAWREEQRVPTLARLQARERAQLLGLCEAVLARHGAAAPQRAAAWWESLLSFELRDRLLVAHGQSRAAYRRTLVSLLLAVAGPQPAASTPPRANPKA